MPKSTRPLDRLRRHLPPGALAAAARDAGYGHRRRKCPPELFFWTLVLGFASETSRSLAALQRFFCVMTGTTITSSAFQKRFTPQAAAFLQGVLTMMLAAAARGTSPAACARLARFHDVFAIDSSLVRLHRKLARHFRGFRSQGTEAMAKLHLVHNLSRRDVERVALTGGRVPDVRGAKLGRWVRGGLVLFDLGYYAHKALATIDNCGGFFISRMKAHANPRVIRMVRHGQICEVYGVPLRELVIEQGELEAEAIFDEGGKNERIYRVVAVREPVSGTWRYYVTNLGAHEFDAEEIAAIYRLRWEVELLFKELKSAYRLHEIPTTKAATARCLLLSALISLLLGRVLADVASLRSNKPLRSLSPRRVAAVLSQNALDLGRALVAGNSKRLGKALARAADLCSALARAAPPRGGAKMLRA